MINKRGLNCAKLSQESTSFLGTIELFFVLPSSAPAPAKAQLGAEVVILSADPATHPPDHPTTHPYEFIFTSLQQ